MVNHLNENEHGHILTIEDPIEFVHESKKCLVNQREVGPHTLSFNNALRSALREDPDCILVGELRDLETIRLALSAAETGHLVFGTLHDPDRDRTTLPLIRAALAAGVPVLGICRGFQELNVALGGSLHQKLHEVEGYIEHREDPSAPVEVQYAPSHAMRVQPGGVLAGLGLPAEFEVNSIHTQGVDQLAPGLRAEAIAPDGLVEAVSVKDGKAFALAVQWHPEWQVSSNPIYLAIFQAFGDACRRRATQRDADASVNA